ncbi:fibronectin type III-like domain-contianing protein [Streptomyces mirabilis]|uniref:fibronectin type III-like domain-contianing protein n=1 Tax=Streptomyces mirabilis TaxID=68239 RepID=UPI0022C80775|nr:fibronectin type III-like domain-contianing protein [Streptomyces mirabilis]
MRRRDPGRCHRWPDHGGGGGSQIQGATSVTVDPHGPWGVVSNAGDRAGVSVSQLHLTELVASVTRPVRQLIGFTGVDLAGRESRVVELQVHTDMTSFTASECVVPSLTIGTPLVVFAAFHFTVRVFWFLVSRCSDQRTPSCGSVLRGHAEGAVAMGAAFLWLSLREPSFNGLCQERTRPLTWVQAVLSTRGRRPTGSRSRSGDGTWSAKRCGGVSLLAVPASPQLESEMT